MYVNVNVFSDDLDELGKNLGLMTKQWNLAPFVLWSCSGTCLRLTFASGPESRGVVMVQAEMLPKSFVSKMAEAKWAWDRADQRGQTVRMMESLFGVGTAETTFTSKAGAVEALKALGAPSDLTGLLRKVKVSRATEWIDELTPESETGDTRVVFSVHTVEKEKHATAKWETEFDGMKFEAELDVGPPRRNGYDGTSAPVYSISVKFDVTPRKEKLLEFLEQRGITAMNGMYQADARY